MSSPPFNNSLISHLYYFSLIYPETAAANKKEKHVDDKKWNGKLKRHLNFNQTTRACVYFEDDQKHNAENAAHENSLAHSNVINVGNQLLCVFTMHAFRERLTISLIKIYVA